MSTRLRTVATIIFVGGLLWVLGVASAWANPLLGLKIDTQCNVTTHQVTILTADISSPHSITLIAQIFVNNAFSDVGSPVQVTIPTGATSTITDVSIPLGSGSGYRVRVVSSDLQNSSGAVSNEVHCALPTATVTPTQTGTSTMTPNPTTTPTITLTATSTMTPNPSASNTPTPTSSPIADTATSTPTSTATSTTSSAPTGGGGGSHSGSSPKVAQSASNSGGVAQAPQMVQQLAAPTSTPSPSPAPIEVAGAQAVVPLPDAGVPPAPIAAPAPAPLPPCLVAASVSPVLDANTGEQVLDQATGLPMWLTVGDDSGIITLGAACAAPPETPLGLPATGDGTAAPLHDGDNLQVP